MKKSFFLKITSKGVQKILILIFLTVLVSDIANAQNGNDKSLDRSITKIEGTYQVLISNTRLVPAIPLEVFKKIESERHATEIKYLKVSENVTIKILPFSEINKIDFKPLNKVEYVN